MKKNQNGWIKVVFVLILALLLVACSNEDPTPASEEPIATAEQPEAEQPIADQPEISQPIANEPEISQPIYRWGEVADKQWVLVGYGDPANPTVVAEGTKITAVFSSVEPTVNGFGGCNNYFVGYESTDDGSLLISGPVGSTMMACEDTMDAEAAYFAALETVSNWALTEEGRLELSYGAEKLIYAPGEVPLTGTTWRLVSWGDPDSPMRTKLSI